MFISRGMHSNDMRLFHIILQLLDFAIPGEEHEEASFGDGRLAAMHQFQEVSRLDVNDVVHKRTVDLAVPSGKTDK